MIRNKRLDEFSELHCANSSLVEGLGQATDGAWSDPQGLHFLKKALVSLGVCRSPRLPTLHSATRG